MAEQFKLNRPLLGTNFFAGDVIAGLGPYIAIYLLSAYHWKPGGIGMALAAGSIATVVAQVPAGAFIDVTYWKRGVLAVCAILVGVSATLIVVTNNPPWIVYSAQVAIGVACAFLGPGIAAVTLGLVGPKYFTAQTSANQAWNHAGNVFGAAVGALLAVVWAPEGLFLLISAMAVGMLVCIAMINGKAINHDLARGGIEERVDDGEPESFLTLLSDRRLLIFALSVVLFHFANAAMLPLVSQKLSIGGDTDAGFAFTSACIIAAQGFMIPMAILCGARADVWGRKILFLAAFAILPIPRRALHALGQLLLPGRRAVLGRPRERHLRHDLSADPARHHARHGTIQRSPGRPDDADRRGGLAQQPDCRMDRADRGLLSGVPVPRRCRHRGRRHLRVPDAGDRAQPAKRTDHKSRKSRKGGRSGRC